MNKKESIYLLIRSLCVLDRVCEHITISSITIHQHVHICSPQVCGAPGDAPCGESPCGGAGCRDDEGNRHCGGLNCNGAVAAADNALERAKLAEKELNKAMGEVEGLFTKVRRCMDAIATLERQSGCSFSFSC